MTSRTSVGKVNQFSFRHLTSDPLRGGLDREAGLRVFLEYPKVPIDTNHLERKIRSIALGRRNRLCCWKEIGAIAWEWFRT